MATSVVPVEPTARRGVPSVDDSQRPASGQRATARADEMTPRAADETPPLPPIGAGRRVAMLAVHHVRVDGQTLTGGAEKYLQMTLRALIASGASVHVGYSGDSIYEALLCEFDPRRLSVERTDWIDSALAGDRGASPALILRRRRWLRAVGADTLFVVQQAAGTTFLASLMAARTLGMRVVASIRQAPEPLPEARRRLRGVVPSPQVWRRRLIRRKRLPARCCHAVIFNSRRVARMYADDYAFNPRRSHVIYNGEAVRPRRRSLPNASEVNIGVVGRVTRAKGADLALDVFAEIARRVANGRLTYFGEGPLTETLRHRAGSLGLAGRVRFAGYSADRDAMYDSMDVALHLSRRESMPNVLIEAAARGIPCVATDVGGVSEVIADGETGFMVPLSSDDPTDAGARGGTVAAATEAVERLIATSEVYARLSAGAQRRAAALFDPRQFALATVRAILGD